MTKANLAIKHTGAIAMLNRDELVADIPVEVASAAHRGTSFVPGERAAQERSEYADTLLRDYHRLAQDADTDEKRATLAEEFARYREGYKRYVLDHLRARSRCLSAMITGPANFPTARNQKANAAAHRRLASLLDFRTRALASIRHKLRPELRPIMSGDTNAGERLADKIAAAEKRQAWMRASNAAIRKHRREGEAVRVAALMELGHSEATAHKLLQPDFAGRVGFADYELANNNANIRRLKARLAVVELNQATPELRRRAQCPDRGLPGREPRAARLSRQARRNNPLAAEVSRLPLGTVARLLAGVPQRQFASHSKGGGGIAYA